MTQRSAREIENWLTDYIAQELGGRPEQISLDEEFVNLGLSSRQAVLLMLEMETWLGQPTDAGLVYDYPTIRSLARFLTSHASAAKV
jgi:polyketide synthase PksN